MEDLDPLRTRTGSAAAILRTLEAFALTWDGEVLAQSDRTGAYEEALTLLTARGLTFECSCSRRELDNKPYPGLCRAGPLHPGPAATRFRVEDCLIAFEDGLQGPQEAPLASLGDVVIRRRDGVFAYQLAVVVDDAYQGVTDVVRGADLLDSTFWQIELQRALGLPTPCHSHLPLLLSPSGEKLAKSRRSLALEPSDAGVQLAEALGLLRLAPPPELAGAPPSVLLEWAVAHWPAVGLRGLREIAV
jgi:glutamyl-Q tRNA(Asp) synthetase